MQASPANVIEFFSGFRQYLIPLFQRPYIWTTREWGTLWADLRSFLDDDMVTGNHFMGAVVTMPVKTVPVGVSTYLLIDGQQRLTTIAILLAAVRDAPGPKADVLRKKIQGHYLTNDGYDKPDFFKILPSHADRSAFAEIVEMETHHQENQFSKAYAFFLKKMRERSEGAFDIPGQVLKVIEQKLMVVNINLSESDDPYLIFESLNAKGSPLKQADLVRNYFMLKFPGKEQQKMYDELWRPMQERLKDGLTEFIRHSLAFEGTEVKREDVYADLKKSADQLNQAELEQKLRQLERLSVYYQRFLEPSVETDSAIRFALQRLQKLKVATIYPLLLKILDDFHLRIFSHESLIVTIDLLESFLVRRAVCSVPSNSLASLFTRICKEWERTPSPEDFLWRNLLKGGGAQRWPDNGEFESAWLNTPLYREKACRLILERLEAGYGHKETVDLSTLTIEHVLPQKLSESWISALGPEHRRIAEIHLHTIGNLTLTGYNPELSNAPFQEKRQVFASSNLELNSWIAGQQSWGPVEIDQRARELFVRALAIWPGPDAESSFPEETDQAEKVKPALFHASCVDKISQHLKLELKRISSSLWQTKDSQLRVSCSVSSLHSNGANCFYWFGFNESQFNFLQAGFSSYAAFGCGSADETLLIPFAALQGWLPKMSKTSGEKGHRHVVIASENGHLSVRLVGDHGVVLVDAYRI